MILPITVPCYIVDDHALFAQGLSRLLTDAGIFEKIVTLRSLDELYALLPPGKGEPGWVFLDYMIPGVSVPDELRRLLAKHKGLTVVMVSSVTNVAVIKNMMLAGCKGYLTKSTGEVELEECVRTIVAGHTYVCHERRDILLQELIKPKIVAFTRKELELLPFLINGVSIEETAAQLHLSRHTIINHRRNMMDKVGVRSVTALVKLALEMGLG